MMLMKKQRIWIKTTQTQKYTTDYNPQSHRNKQCTDCSQHIHVRYLRQVKHVLKYLLEQYKLRKVV